MAEQPVLKKGADGNAVKGLQKALVAAGQACAVDGDFGPGTERAVKAFQAARGLTADGVVGPATWKALGVGAQASGGGGKYSLSVKGAAFIGHFEGFRGDLYNDPVGHCTIGFGHLVHHGPINGSEPAEFKRSITRERALELLQRTRARPPARSRAASR